MHTASLRKLNTTNETHQILVCADDVKLLGENIDRINRNTETMLYFGDEVSLEVNWENAEQNYNRPTKVANTFFKNVVKFKYLGRPAEKCKLCSRAR
jgi:hypothetical protein